MHSQYNTTVKPETMSKLNNAFASLRRKRGEKGEVVETVEDVIVRRLTVDRIDELKKLIKETQETHRYMSIELQSVDVSSEAVAVKSDDMLF